MRTQISKRNRKKAFDLISESKLFLEYRAALAAGAGVGIEVRNPSLVETAHICPVGYYEITGSICCGSRVLGRLRLVVADDCNGNDRVVIIPPADPNHEYSNILVSSPQHKAGLARLLKIQVLRRLLWVHEENGKLGILNVKPIGMC